MGTKWGPNFVNGDQLRTLRPAHSSVSSGLVWLKVMQRCDKGSCSYLPWYYLVVIARKVPLLCNDPCWVPFYFLLRNGFLLTRVFCSHSLPRVSTPFQFSTNAEPFFLQDFLHFSGLCYLWISALIRPSHVQQRTLRLEVEISCALRIYNNVQIEKIYCVKSSGASFSSPNSLGPFSMREGFTPIMPSVASSNATTKMCDENERTFYPESQQDFKIHIPPRLKEVYWTH